MNEVILSKKYNILHDANFLSQNQKFLHTNEKVLQVEI